MSGLGLRSIVRPLSRPLVRSSGGGGVFTLASLFTGGVPGYILDGRQQFNQSSGGAVAGNSDPIGFILDGSGNGNNPEQLTSGNKPVNVVTNGINAIQFATQKFLGLSLPAEIPPATDACSVYVLHFNFQYVWQLAIPLLTHVPFYDYLLVGGGVEWRTNNTQSATIAGVFPIGILTTRIIIVNTYYLTGTHHCDIEVCDMAGATTASTSGAPSGEPTFKDIIIGDNLGTSPPATAEMAFEMLIGKRITGADLTNVKSDLVTGFGGWK